MPRRHGASPTKLALSPDGKAPATFRLHAVGVAHRICPRLLTCLHAVNIFHVLTHCR